MNPSSCQPQQPSEEESHSNGHNEQGSVRSTDGESATAILNNEVLLMIFRYLNVNDLLKAEQVCLHWKAIVDTCFATKTTLKLVDFRRLGGYIALEMMKRYGHQLKSLHLFYCGDDDDNIDWIAEIVNAFPNLLSLSLSYIPIRSESLRILPVKFCKLVKISLTGCSFSDEDLGIVLKGFPGLKHLKLSLVEIPIGECFRELGSNIQYLSLSCVEITPAGTSHILSRCSNLQKLKIHDYEFKCSAQDFSKFCETTPLRQLSIKMFPLPKEVYLPISRLSLLEKLVLDGCGSVDSDVLIRISLGCPNLKYVCLVGLPLVCDRGVKCFAQCKHLTQLHCLLMKTVTDESLFEFAKARVLETLLILHSEISDSGLAAILAQCPQLKSLDISHCSGVGDSTVDAAIQAVESRGRMSATLNQSPHGKGTAIVTNYKNVKPSGYLLHLRMKANGRLDRYKDGFSHPLLFFKID